MGVSGPQKGKSDSLMPSITGEGDLSGNTNSTVARLLSPDEVVGILSGGFSRV